MRDEKMSQASRTRKNQRKLGLQLGIACIAAGVTIFVLLAAFVWIPSSSSPSSEQKSMASTVSFSTFPDGTDLNKIPQPSSPLFICGSTAITQITVNSGVASITGMQPDASLPFRTAQQHAIIGESIEIQCKIQNARPNYIYFINQKGQTIFTCSVRGSFFSTVSKTVSFSSLIVDEKMTLTFYFANTTSCVVKIETSSETKTITDLITGEVTSTTVLSMIIFGGSATPDVSTTSWKLLSIKTTWANAFIV